MAPTLRLDVIRVLVTGSDYQSRRSAHSGKTVSAVNRPMAPQAIPSRLPGLSKW